jgi:hypothetical protein
MNGNDQNSSNAAARSTPSDPATYWDLVNRELTAIQESLVSIQSFGQALPGVLREMMTLEESVANLRDRVREIEVVSKAVSDKDVADQTSISFSTSVLAFVVQRCGQVSLSASLCVLLAILASGLAVWSRTNAVWIGWFVIVSGLVGTVSFWMVRLRAFNSDRVLARAHVSVRQAIEAQIRDIDRRARELTEGADVDVRAATVSASVAARQLLLKMSTKLDLPPF